MASAKRAERFPFGPRARRALARLEHRLVYPGAYLRGRLPSPPAGVRRVRLRTEDGFGLTAWRLDVAAGADRLLIYLHGQGGTLPRYLPWARALTERGWPVLLVEYRGYGGNPGRPSETGLLRDAVAAWEHARATGVPPERIAVWGYSLGSGVGAALAACRPLGALVLEAPYSSVPDAAGALYRVAPVRWMRQRFATLERAAELRPPLLVLHARDDLMVPQGQGRRVFAAAPEPKEFLAFRGGHAALADARVPSALDGAAAFLDRAVPPAP